MKLRGRNVLLIMAIAMAISIAFFQVIAVIQVSRQSQSLIENLSRLQSQKLEGEKLREEFVALKLENQLKTMFWNSLLGTVGPTITAIVAILGALIGLGSYLSDRKKERIDRGAEALKDTLGFLVASSSRERAMGAIGLQHFISTEKEEYHQQVLLALSASARIEDDVDVRRCLEATFRQAIKAVPAEVVRRITWRGAKLGPVQAEKVHFDGIDFCDADLENANFKKAKLTNASFRNACLKGADFAGADLAGADLTYADLAGANLAGANLKGADLTHAMVLQLNIQGAKLDGAKFDEDKMPWGLIRGWRDLFDSAELRARLTERFGPLPSGPRVLMLMWELPPLVAGGSWTACYHLVRNLRRSGADVTVAVPWSDSMLLPNPFGCDATILSLGIDMADEQPFASSTTSAYGAARVFGPYGAQFNACYGSSYETSRPYWNTYNPIYSPYNLSYSPYGTYSNSPYSWTSPYGQTAKETERGAQSWKRTPTMIRLIEKFAEQLGRRIEKGRFDIIHAHDWVTFTAAEKVSQSCGIPWIAHFHSTEEDRRPLLPDFVVKGIEQRATERAGAMVTPSAVTKSRLVHCYEALENNIHVIPNCLSEEPMSLFHVGDFDSKQSVFLGRLTSQKGPDYYVDIARRAKSVEPGWRFAVYGDGELAPELFRGRADVELYGPLPWEERVSAFAGACAAIVPSRAEPFGMVVLEAMQCGVPVFCAEQAGVLEVVTSCIKIAPENAVATTEKLVATLRDWNKWHAVVDAQLQEVRDYPSRGYEKKLMELWSSMVNKPIAAG